jgi:hypothetical protein
MLFCSDEKCVVCLLIEGSADCLRRQAYNCVIASKKKLKRGIRDALDQLSLNLMDEAAAVEREQKIPPASIDLC